MKMTLAVLDRMVLLMLSRDGKIESDITTWREMDRLRESVGFTDAENKLLEFEDRPEGGTHWKDTVGPIEVEVTDTVRAAIGGVLKNMNKNKRLKEIHRDLYEMFCEEPDKPELVK